MKTPRKTVPSTNKFTPPPKKENPMNPIHALPNIFFLVLGLVAVLNACSACTVVDAGEVAVVSTFGEVSKDVLTPGAHLIAPWRTTTTYSTQIQEYTMSASSNEGAKSGDDSLHVLSADGLEVAIDATVIYRIDESKAVDIYKTIGSSESITSKVIRPASRTRVRDSAVAYTAIDLYGAKRDAFQKTVFDAVAGDFALRGILLEQFMVRDMKLPESVKHSIEDKIAAEQAAQKMQYVLQKAQQEAEQKRVEAHGVADAQKILESGLSPKLLQYEAIKAQAALASSPNAKVVVVPQGTNFILGNQ